MANAYERIAQQTEKHERIQTLMHYVNKQNLIEEHKLQQKGKAKGIDGVDKEAYEENLETNIDDLLKRMKTFSYRPQAVRRTYIPKDGSDKLRPLGIPAYEDKLVQGVMRKVIDQIYEGKFYDFSYGFREGKSCHQAIREVNQLIMTKKIGFIVDADICGFFDNLSHEWLMKFLEHEIADKNFLRYIKRFLKAGIMEDMQYHESDKGAPQGGLISPVCGNVYLHYVLDIWFDKVVKKQCTGEAHIVRYADDFICMFQYENEANAFYEALETRLKKFNLELSKDKSKIIRFGRFAKQHSTDGKTETFDFLGLHRTSQKKLKVKKQNVKEWLKENIHGKPSDTISRLNKKLVGHYRYYGISGNYEGLMNFYHHIKAALYKTLTRRSQRAYLTWRRFSMLLEKHPIAEPKIFVNIWKSA